MTRLKIWTLALALCAISPLTHPQEIPGRIIFSVELVEWSLRVNADGSKGPKKRTGVFYYYQAPESRGSFEYGASITGYKFRDGEIVSVAGEGSYSAEELLKKLNAISLSSFDVQKEIDTTLANQWAEATKSGRNFPVLMVADGAKYRIRYDFNGVSIDHTDWNPGAEINHLAPYSENLGKLNALLDLFATRYGRREFGL